MGRLFETIPSRVLSLLFFSLLAALVVITWALGKPRRNASTIDFPPPLGVKLIVCGSLAFWILLLFAPLDLGMYWLAALFALGSVYTIWHWPETISIDDLRIHQSAWCHPKVSILWAEITSIEISSSGNVMVLRRRSGGKVTISSLQVGVVELIGEIRRRTGWANPQITIGDRVRVLSTDITDALGVAGHTGIVHSQTTPSFMGVAVIEKPARGYAFFIQIEGRNEPLWLAEHVLEFVDHAAGTGLEISGQRFIRDEAGNGVK